MNTALALTLTLSFAAGDFDAAKEKAVEIDSLKTVVTTLVGLCDIGNQFEQQDCRTGLKKKAKEMRGNTHYVYLGPQERGLRFEGERRGKVRVLWTPIVDAGNGLAITLVKPRKLSKDGSVVVPQKPVDVVLASDVLDSELQRFVRTGQVTIEMVGTFGKTWKLGRGKRRTQGVIFKPVSIRLAHARTGKTLGDWDL